MELNISIIDRKTKAVNRTVENPSGSDNPLCMRLIPLFDYEKFPFALIRDKDSVNLINLRTGSAYKGFSTWYQQLPFPQMLLDCQKAPDSSAIDLYVLEYTGKNSAIVKYEMTADYVGALKLIIKQDL